MQDKPEIIYRSILVILFIIFLDILYGYSENGRYRYYNEKIENSSMTGNERYVVDTRAGIIYGHIDTIGDTAQETNDWYYKNELTTGKYWINGELIRKNGELTPRKTKQTSSK